MGNPQNIFLNALWGLRHVMPPPPPLQLPHWSDNSREGNTTQSQSEGAVRGDRHCPLSKLVLNNLLKTQGFYKADTSFFISQNEKCAYLFIGR